MKGFLLSVVFFALSWTICIFACNPSVYRPDKAYLKQGDLVETHDGKIYVFDGAGWFTVERLQMDEVGTFYINPKLE